MLPHAESSGTPQRGANVRSSKPERAPPRPWPAGRRPSLATVTSYVTMKTLSAEPA
ncbi:hypothetical protein [Streptomyces sp. NPDC005827]|uniref:hypothetical protein n=1 Tax=Streptomyces sp. NPDC005827 TaxID=3157070 RepID=UPI0033FAFFA7